MIYGLLIGLCIFGIMLQVFHSTGVDHTPSFAIFKSTCMSIGLGMWVVSFCALVGLFLESL